MKPNMKKRKSRENIEKMIDSTTTKEFLSRLGVLMILVYDAEDFSLLGSGGELTSSDSP